MLQEQKLEQETKSGKNGQKNDDDKLSSGICNIIEI